MADSTENEHNDFIRDIIKHDLENGQHQTTITRFPPEPNGYLHIGHAFSICLNFGIAQENQAIGAKCHLRFDDTNPVKEDIEYVDSIKEDVKWLGFEWGNNLFFASHYFSFFYDCALALIKDGKAYVDLQSSDSIRAQKGDANTLGTESPYRNSTPDENLELFKKMKKGEFQEGEAVLRAKIDMSAENLNLRDPLIYRIIHTHHHQAGNEWCIYPLYDFAHPLEDAKEGITHSLCSLEFEIRRPLYNWFVENCPVPSKPKQYEFARLNLNYTVLSKRKIQQLVDDKLVTSWDDPRLMTISGLRRRGYTSEAIRNYCKKIGVTKFVSLRDMAVLDFELRQNLNQTVDRRMAVLNPVKVVITNLPDEHYEEVTCLNNPENEHAGTRQVPLTKEIYIEQEDFMEEPPNKKYKRLAPGKYVRLRGGYIIGYQSHEKDANGKISQINVEYLPGTIGENPPEGIKCKAAIHWVSATENVDAEIRLYDRLFNAAEPDKVEGGYQACINPNSLEVITHAKLETSLKKAPQGYPCQFERIGYFITDNQDHSEKTPVFNRTIGLKDSWK